MASVKVASLLIKTISKPIANKLKQQAQEHASFRKITIALAQQMHRSEARLRTGFLGEPKTAIRPLVESKAVTNGATALAEGFLFFVGVSLIAGEAYRSSRSAGKRRDDVDDRLVELKEGLDEMRRLVEGLKEREEGERGEGDKKIDHLSSILSQIITIGLRGGWLSPDSLPSPSSSSSPTSPLSATLPSPTTAYISSSDPPPFPEDPSSPTSSSSSAPSSPPSSPSSSSSPDRPTTSEAVQPFVALRGLMDRWPRSTSTSRRGSEAEVAGGPVTVGVEDVWTEEMIDGRVHVDGQRSEADQ